MAVEQDLAAVLAQVHFFRGLAEASRRHLASIAIPRFVRKGTTLFHEGDDGHSVYLVTRGRVELSRLREDGNSVVITVVQPGHVFAEIVLFEKDRFPVTAKTLADCNLYLFPRCDIRGLLAEATFRNDFLAMLFKKQRHLTEQILRAASGDLETRFWEFLREQYGEAKTIRADMTKRAVAAALRTTPESLSRLLKRLAGQKRLTWNGPVIRIADFPKSRS